MSFRLLALLAFFFNFSFGALLPLLPELNVRLAGVAFSAFATFKLIGLVPAGLIGDRLGHGRGVTLALLLQTAGLAAIAGLPSQPWIGRILEGLALAQGNISTISLLRALSPDMTLFARRLNRLLAMGGLGAISGPIAGYWLLSLGGQRPVAILCAATAALTVLHVVRLRPIPRPAPAPAAAAVATDAGPPSRRSLLWLVAGFAAAKAVSLGWQPNLAWWAGHDLGLNPTLAGLSFVLLGLCFMLGALRPWAAATLPAIGGFLLLELSLRGVPLAFWPAMAVLGYWYGCYVTLAVGRLGWNRPETIGRHNSGWMLITDLPMSLTPVLLWELRAPSPAALRLSLGLGILAVAALGLWRGLRPLATSLVEPRVRSD